MKLKYNWSCRTEMSTIVHIVHTKLQSTYHDIQKDSKASYHVSLSENKASVLLTPDQVCKNTILSLCSVQTKCMKA